MMSESGVSVCYSNVVSGYPCEEVAGLTDLDTHHGMDRGRKEKEPEGCNRDNLKPVIQVGDESMPA
eukprot:1800400-Rhodomonas_salina.1